MSDVIMIKEKIEEKIKLSETGRKDVEIVCRERANAIREYDVELAKSVLLLKSEGDTFNGETVFCKTDTAAEKIARGIVAERGHAFNKEFKDKMCRGHFAKMTAVEAELNGYQSINRHLD